MNKEIDEAMNAFGPFEPIPVDFEINKTWDEVAELLPRYGSIKPMGPMSSPFFDVTAGPAVDLMTADYSKMEEHQMARSVQERLRRCVGSRGT